MLPTWTRWWLAGALATLAAAGAVAGSVGGAKPYGTLTALTVIAALGLMLAGLVAATQGSRGDERTAWWLMFAGAVTLAASVAWGITGGSAREHPDTIWLAWLVVYPAWFTAAFLMDRGRLRRLDAGRTVADDVVVLVILVLAFQQILPVSALVEHRSTLNNVADAAFPIADLALVWFMISPVLLGRVAMDARRALLCAAFTVWAVADTGWMTVAGFPYEPVFATGALILGAAGVAAAAHLWSPPEREAGLRRAWIVDLVPYGVVAALVGIVAWREFASIASKPLAIGMLVAATALFLREVLTLRESRQRLAGAEARALTDPLTGLGNARAFQDRLAAEVARSLREGSHVALLMIDVDRLKVVNDTGGHLAGDRLLGAVADGIHATIRVSDVACRIGGDEMAVIAPGASSQDAELIGRRILASIREFELPGIPAEALSASVGLAVLPDDAQSQSELLANADAALYAAKRAGRGRVERFVPDRAVAGGLEIATARTAVEPGALESSLDDITARRRDEARGWASEGRFRTLVETANEGIVVTGVDDTIDFVNARFCEMVGRGADDVVGISMYDVIHPADRAAHRVKVEQAKRSLAPGRFELRLWPADGRELWIEASATPFPDEEGRFRGGVLLATDITERRRTRERLQESEGRFRALADSAPMLIWMTGADGGAVFVNRTWLDFTGRPLQDQIGFGWSQSVHPEDRGATWRALSAAWEARRSFEIEHRLRRHDGEYRWMINAGRPRITPEGELTGYVGSAVDITERRRTQERLARLAYADDLTGLPNRARLEDFVRDALEHRRGGEALTLLSLGLDRFKLINDGLGGEAADAVLKEVARRIDAATPEGGIAARNFSDEFMVCAPAGAAVDAEQVALDLADTLHGALGPPIHAEGQELFVTMSIGVSLLPGDAGDATGLLAHADRAMDECKGSMPGGTSLFRGATPAASHVLTATSRLRRAIERDELVMHYQPVVDIASARAEGATVEEITLGRHVVGAEALVRWQEPGGALLMPHDFVPLAERTGLIGALGGRVARDVARQQARWQSQGFDARVGFNLSAIELHDPKLVDRLLAAIEAEGADPARMVIELTETAAMADLERTSRVMHALRARGIEISIDDFGTGYSALGRLRDFEADHVKIDASFLAAVPEEEAAAGLLAGIVRLADGAGYQPLAEGIETQAQWDFLVACGCRLGQGRLFSLPVPAAAMTAILAQGRPSTPPAAAPPGDVSRGRVRRPGAPERRPHRRASS